MEELLAEVFSKYGILGLGFIVFAYAIWQLASYYLKVIIPQNREERQRQLTMLQEMIDSQQKLLAEHNTMLSNNTNTLGSVARTMEKLSDKMLSLDERSASMASMLSTQNNAINSIQEKAASNESISRVHDRIDGIYKGMASKTDITLIQADIKDLGESVYEVAEKTAENGQALAEIKIMVPNACKGKVA